MTKDRRDNNITINKRTLVISLVIVVSLSVFLVVSGPLSSSLLSSPVKIKQVRAQQQPTSRPQQPSSKSQQPISQAQQPSNRAQLPSSQPQQPSSQQQQPSSPSSTTSPPSSTSTTTSSTSSAPTSTSTSPSSTKINSCAQQLRECKSNALDSEKLQFDFCEGEPSAEVICRGLVINTFITNLNKCQANFQKCREPTCPSGLTNCNDECVDLKSSTQNCGACGVACTGGTLCNPDPTTGKSTCSCPAGEQVCNGQCISTDTDLNCGGCGVQCTGFTTCKADSSGGGHSCQCISGQLGDNNNCGACGIACTGGQSCQNGACACPADKPNLVNGQCQECPAGQVPGTGTDAGKCVRDCSSLGPGEQFCSSFGECVNTNTDNLNCGSCGNSCSVTKPGTSCVNGVCSPTVPRCVPDQTDPTGQLCQSCSSGGRLLCASCISITSTC